MSRDYSVKLYMDGADINDMLEMYQQKLASGFTTNPTLMRQAGISDYEKFARQAIAAIPDLPISFEVFSDDLETMEKEARLIASWGGNTYIKIPITNTQGVSTIPLIKKLSSEGFSLNVTAIMTVDQVESVLSVLSPNGRTIISVFAGRVADTGVDPVKVMRACSDLIKQKPNTELLWASSRELLNIFHAEESGCDIITVTPAILKKLPLIGKDLQEYSLDTVKMFYRDATAAGYNILQEECIL